jgi:DNA-directed RNA polymerase subunit F
MIKKQTALSMAEVEQLMKTANIENQELEGFIKKFSVLKKKDAQEMEKEIEDLKIIKLRKEDVVKIIDFVPENSQDLNKILPEISLDEDEKNKILEISKKYR